ncbi:DUF1524 domain-containing protein [Corynebacterium sp. L4756]|uniref:HNH endonuclease family protein n=1 Tax=unclassified Corynebacterium TaxID=2624378 RepID=UPI00374D077C
MANQPYRVTVFSTSTTRARPITTSETPATIEDAAVLARKAAIVKRMRSSFLGILSITTIIYATANAVPYLNPVRQEGLAPLSETLPRVVGVEDRTKVPGYNRDAFGNWAPVAGTCTTRDMVIFSQSPNAADCTEKMPTVFDPYAQEAINADDIEVDHIFPLSAAWDHGAHAWDSATLRQFANDPLNLVATSRAENQDKSDALPNEWLPPHPSARCWYSERVAAVATAYELTLSEETIATMHRQCQLGILFTR